MSNQCIDAVLDELSAVGIRPLIEQGGKHIHISWSSPAGERRQVVGKTPSDWRAIHNERAQTRRMLREDGLIADSDVVVSIDRPHLNIKSGSPVVNSLDIARHFDKAHKDILRAIDRAVDETGQEFGGRNFAPSSYITEQNKEIRCYDLTRDGFSFLVMGFTGGAASRWKVAYIDAFNAMESELRSRLPALPENIEHRLSRVESDISGLIDMMATPRDTRRIRSGVFLRASVRRRLMKIAA